MKVRNTLALLALSLSLAAQRVEPYAFSGSLSSGSAQVNDFARNSSLGISGSYHRQYNAWFSLQTSLEVQYLLPSVEIQSDFVNGVGSYLGVRKEYVSGGLLFGPFVHFRDEGFNMHLGLQLGAGYGYYGRRTTTDNNLNNYGSREWDNFTMMQSRIMAGVLFPLRDRYSELGLNLSYFLNLEPDNALRRVFQHGYRIGFVYHYNLVR